jgi:hypothetical protein
MIDVRQRFPRPSWVIRSCYSLPELENRQTKVSDDLKYVRNSHAEFVHE